MKKIIYLFCIIVFIAFVYFMQKPANKTKEQMSTSVAKTSSAQQGGLDLTISSPTSGAVVALTEIVVKGKVNPRANVIVNDEDIKLSIDGTFEKKLPIDEGDNYISVVAYDDLGNSAERELLITRTISGI